MSFLYLTCNLPTVQVLVLKRCIRYFKRMQATPRFVTKFYNSVHSMIEPSLCGKNTIFFWPSMEEAHAGAMECPSILYFTFKEEVTEHLSASTRIRDSGTLPLMLEMLEYCFKGSPTVAPFVI